MEYQWTEYSKYLAGLLAIVNPIGAIPLFINLTNDQVPAEKKRSATIASLTTAVVLLVTLFTGETLLRFFGITIASFRVGGGLLLLLIAISMLNAKTSPTMHTEEEAQDSSERDSIAVVPVGIPILAGPGAISTIILYSQRSTMSIHYLLLSVEIFLVGLAVWLSLRSAPRLASLLGRTGINIVTRIMGLIMTAIGVEFIANGLKQLFPVLG